MRALDRAHLCLPGSRVPTGFAAQAAAPSSDPHFTQLYVACGALE
jgi:hypothetical protein